MKYIWLILAIIADIGVGFVCVIGWQMTENHLPLEISLGIVYAGIFWIMVYLTKQAIDDLR